MKRFVTCVTFLVVLTASCSDDQLIEQSQYQEAQIEAQYVKNMPGEGIPGRICVEISAELTDKIQISNAGDFTMNVVPTPMATALKKLGAKKMTSVFYHDERFAAREKAEGLDRWFYVEIDEKINLDYAVRSLSGVNGISYVEKVYEKTFFDTPVPAVCNNYAAINSAADQEMPFDDPKLNLQWHYKNFGTYSNSVPGADMNVFEAWNDEVGKKNVIVGVIDGGIYYQHEDLNDNMWVNTGEIPGNGIDDDGNGMIDDVYGWNTCMNNGNIYADDAGHGTHVAGTIGARNNNGIGVCGVAGGDGTPTSGVRLMSCMIFGGKLERGNSSMAFQYAANNGAVITNNSWGYSYPGPVNLPASDKKAIDYFIKYAGVDADGNQREDSPMKGGLVLFAAGNDNKEFKAWPAPYEEVIAVSAMAPDWKKAWYSNFGTWVDIMAPGGDQFFNKGEVLSTFPSEIGGKPTGQKYKYMQGTSMATPHMTGLCALALSKFGGPGYTCDQLKKRVLSGIRPKNIDNTNLHYKGKLGLGYADAARALDVNKNKAPEQVSHIEGRADFVSIHLSWKSVADEDDGTPLKYNIYWSKKKFLDNLDGVHSVTIPCAGIKKGTLMNHKITNLSLDTKYYIGIQAVDRWGLKSKLTIEEFQTKKNNPPVITNLPKDLIRVEGIDIVEFDIDVNDPDGHKVFVEVEGDTKGVNYKYKNGKIHFKIRALAPVGMYKVKIRATDIYNAYVEAEIPFEVYQYIPPKISKSLNLEELIGVNDGEKVVDLTNYFSYTADAKVHFVVKTDNPEALSTSVEGSVLRYRGLKSGKVEMVVELYDSKNYSKTPLVQKADFIVVPDSKAMVYECDTRVTNSLNIFMNPTIQKADVIIRSVQGNTVFDKTVKPAVNGGRIKIGMKKVAIGTYKLIIKSKKGDYEKTFVKL